MTQTRTLRHSLALGLALALFALPATPNDLSAQVFKHGDVNGDGVVSALDAQAILTGVVDLPLPAGFILANGDANCDETTGALDAQIVLSFVIGLDVSQHCVGQNFGPGATQIELTPVDSSLLVGRGLWMKATLKDSAGFLIERPVSWSTSNAAIVAIDTMRNDSAFVKGTGEGSATITVFADGSGWATCRRFRR